MSAQPPITYLGTRSHQRRGKRSCHVKSYRALISTAIRRRFGGSECWDTVGESQNDRVFPSSSNNNKFHSCRVRVKANLQTSDKFKKKPELKKQAKNAIPSISGRSPKAKTQDHNDDIQKSMDDTSIEMSSKDAQEKQEDLPDSRVPLTSAQGLPSPGSSTSETSDYQRSTPSPNNEADIQNDLNSEWVTDAQLKADPTLGDEGFSETIGCQEPQFHNKQPTKENEDDLRDEILSNSLDSCDVFINNFEDLDDELGPLHIDEDEPPKSCMAKQQTESTNSDETDAKRIKHENDSFPSFFHNLSPQRKAPFQGNVSSSSGNHCEVQIGEKKDSKSEKSNLFSLENYDTSMPEMRKIKTEDVDLEQNFHPSNETLTASPSESQSSSGLSTPEQKIPKTEQVDPITKIQKDDNVFEVPLPPGQYHSSSPCKWINCLEKFSSSDTLFDHIKMEHIVQSGSRDDVALYKCFWKGCKVYGKGSSSKSWLEKHVANHCGRKPFACIFEGCSLRFSTQSLMQRHVNHHFKPTTSSSQSNGSNSTSSIGTNETKFGSTYTLQKPNRKFLPVCHTPIRRQFFLPRMFDFFDDKSVAMADRHLEKLEKRRYILRRAGIIQNNLSLANILDQIVVFSATIKARRRTVDGRDDVLLAWNPTNLIADEWVPRSDVKQTKCVKVRSLSSIEREKTIAFIISESGSTPRNKRARKRKPLRRPRATPKYHNDIVQALLESRDPLKS